MLKGKDLKKALLIAGLFLFSSNTFAGDKYFSFTRGCQEAYYKMISWHFDEADAILKQEKATYPDNLIPYFIENYHDFLILGFNENKTDFDLLEANKDKRLSLMKEGDEDSPYYLYTQAEISMQWALVNLKFQNFTSAFFDIRRAYSDLNENKKMFPGFTANNKTLGMLHAMIGTVPDTYKWAARILGFSGTVEQGTAELDSVMSYGEKNPFLFTTETRYMYLLLKVLILNDTKGAVAIVNNPDFPDFKDNALSCFVHGYIASRDYRNDEAITYFKYNREVNKTSIYFNDYTLGFSLLSKLDYPAAEQYLGDFTREFKGENYIKDAWRRLAWCSLLQGDVKKYYVLLDSIKPVGLSLTDSDKDAEDVAKNRTKPNVILLRARLLSDGGYYERALNELDSKKADAFTNKKDKLEFTYRTARIYALEGDSSNAILYYKATIAEGGKVRIYFAANAALELGNLYESHGDYANAKYYYQQCLDMPYSDYKDSIDVKAKAGLQRVSGK